MSQRHKAKDVSFRACKLRFQPATPCARGKITEYHTSALPESETQIDGRLIPFLQTRVATCTATCHPISVSISPYICTNLTLHPYTPDPISVYTRPYIRIHLTLYPYTPDPISVYIRGQHGFHPAPPYHACRARTSESGPSGSRTV
jgi:hypothetical protein